MRGAIIISIIIIILSFFFVFVSLQSWWNFNTGIDDGWALKQVSITYEVYVFFFFVFAQNVSHTVYP